MEDSSVKYERYFNLDDIPMNIWGQYRDKSKYPNPTLCRELLVFLVKQAFPCEIIAVPNVKKAEAVVVASRPPDSDSEVIIEVVKIAPPTLERNDKILSDLSKLLKEYNCDHGVVLTHETAVIFKVVNDQENEGRLEEVKEIELTKAGYKALGRYWCSLKPQFALDYEWRIRTENYTDEDFYYAPEMDFPRDADNYRPFIRRPDTPENDNVTEKATQEKRKRGAATATKRKAHTSYKEDAEEIRKR